MKVEAFKLDKKTGRYFANELPFYVRPYYLVPDNYNTNPVNPSYATVPAAAGAWSAEVKIRSIPGGAFEGAYLTMYYYNFPDGTEDFLVSIRDINRSINITGRPCHVRTVFSQVVAPWPEYRYPPVVLPESIFLNEKEGLGIRFQRIIAGDEENVQPIIHGQMMFFRKVINNDIDEYIRRRILRARQMMPYFCPLDEDPVVPAGSEVEVWFTQDLMCHFDVRKLAYFATSDGVALGFKFRIVDEYGQELTNNWIRSVAGLGSAPRPSHTTGPWCIRAGGKVKFIIRNLDPTYDLTVYLTLIGRQFFT